VRTAIEAFHDDIAAIVELIGEALGCNAAHVGADIRTGLTIAYSRCSRCRDVLQTWGYGAFAIFSSPPFPNKFWQ
jgi:hypothetical protein